ncbi:tail fiber protein [Salmonella enterica]|nr:tail fiber protein [Salmonella enterica]EKP2024952.1 tail fiber protein [Salmonella enterica]EKP2052690.1 tail fiber protein [Salmonella enterica]
MGKLTELEQWDEDVYQIETSDPVLGGPDGISNRPQKQLANRTQWLKKRLEDANNALAEHEKSRNHPDATLTAKGFVRLYSGVTSMDETLAATPKAVKIAMDNANERLAKARNLADLQSIPLALANLTLADVKKYVESTNTGVSKLPRFRPSSEDDLTSLPAGYMALAKNSTPGGPLPDEDWFYLEVAGNLDNPSNNPNRKGAVIRLTRTGNPGISWTGAKFDDGTTTTAKFNWARDFSTLNKPTPEDVGLAATKKAIDDTQTGLAAQGVMWISTADDLSNLPSGARRFARNNTGITVLPAAGYFFLEVLAKRDTANGSCILATNDARDVWIGFRYTVPDEAGFTWIQLNQNVQNLGLTETVKRAANAVQKNGDTMTGNLFLKSDARMHFAIVNEDGNARMWFYKDKGGDGVRLNNGVDGGGEFVFAKNGDFYSPGKVHAGAAILAGDGNVWGTRWKAGGAWLWDAITEQLTARDNNINARATIAWVNQNFVKDVRMGANQSGIMWGSGGGTVAAGYVLTGGNFDDDREWPVYAPVQKNINGIWHNVGRE